MSINTEDTNRKRGHEDKPALWKVQVRLIDALAAYHKGDHLGLSGVEMRVGSRIVTHIEAEAFYRSNGLIMKSYEGFKTIREKMDLKEEGLWKAIVFLESIGLFARHKQGRKRIFLLKHAFYNHGAGQYDSLAYGAFRKVPAIDQETLLALRRVRRDFTDDQIMYTVAKLFDRNREPTLSQMIGWLKNEHVKGEYARERRRVNNILRNGYREVSAEDEEALAAARADLSEQRTGEATAYRNGHDRHLH